MRLQWAQEKAPVSIELVSVVLDIRLVPGALRRAAARVAGAPIWRVLHGAAGRAEGSRGLFVHDEAHTTRESAVTDWSPV
jgi:hypothetical protein